MVLFFIIACLLIIGIVVLSVIFRANYEKHKGFVELYSTAIKDLTSLNTKFKFHNIDSPKMTHTYDNENFYKQISCQDYLIYQMQFEQHKFLKQITLADSNKSNYEQYKIELKSLSKVGTYSKSHEGLNFEKLIKIENKLIKQKVLQPSTSFSVSVELCCAKMNGSIHSRKSKSFSQKEIMALSSKLDDKSGNFYNDKSIWDAICRVERGKVSNAMRFSIYKKDGYKCRMCGAKGKNVVLEIDHIFPIAKGGKSVYNNLQTLCHKCNVAKGTSTDFYNQH